MKISFSRVNLPILFLTILQLSVSVAKRHEVYIVQIGDDNSAKKSLMEMEEHHFSYLSSIKKSNDEAKASLLYSYKHIMNGFSALLTQDEADSLSDMDGVVSVVKSEHLIYTTQTTRSWHFTASLEREHLSTTFNGDEAPSNGGKDVIIGVIDTGVWPESKSFNDEGMGAVPQSWNGICQTGEAFNSSHCNRKLIGARYYLKGNEARYGPLDNDFLSARDRDGHGTHTASTAAGREVPHAALTGGYGGGTAAGGAPLARLAVYKVCWAVPRRRSSAIFASTCYAEDIIAAFEDAVNDGVHVISISIVPYKLYPYGEDSIVFGAFRAATRRDILVVACAGNSGPAASSVRNLAPWIVSVGASSIDRVFSSTVELGNGVTIQCDDASLSRMRPLVYAGDVELAGAIDYARSGLCLSNTLSPELVEGKIVLCLRGLSSNQEKGLEVKRAGGLGFILQNPVDGISASVADYLLAGTTVFSNDSATVLDYIRSCRGEATARFVPPSTVVGTVRAPFMAGFSSTGPNSLDPNIIKPDITAPGLNIIAAWSEGTSPTKLYADGRTVTYNTLSGTSMSCPHVAAAAALVKAAHPDWSSAAIRSALMTTATQTDNAGLPIADGGGSAAATPFNFGSGHFRPSAALDPGLVYDVDPLDYLLYLCSFGPDLRALEPSFACPDRVPPPSDLNYPSLAVARVEGTVTVRRTVTNVGPGRSRYTVTIIEPAGYTVEIEPAVLRFSAAGEKKSFTITVRACGGAVKNAYAFGSFVWSDGTHRVTNPIAVSTP